MPQLMLFGLDCKSAYTFQVLKVKTLVTHAFYH